MQPALPYSRPALPSFMQPSLALFLPCPAPTCFVQPDPALPGSALTTLLCTVVYLWAIQIKNSHRPFAVRAYLILVTEVQSVPLGHKGQACT